MPSAILLNGYINGTSLFPNTETEAQSRALACQAYNAAHSLCDLREPQFPHRKVGHHHTSFAGHWKDSEVLVFVN